jgi:hypothetical protein
MVTTQEWLGIQAEHRAEELYRKAYLRGWARRLTGLLLGRARHLSTLPAGLERAPKRQLRAVALHAIQGSAVEVGGYDDRFNPTDPAGERRWRQLAAAQIRGESLPPVEVVQAGAAFYVRAGHRRVSTARALGLAQIDALIVATAALPTNQAPSPAMREKGPAARGSAQPEAR